jgi:hypothetical protein
LDSPSPQALERSGELGPAIGGVGEDVTQPGKGGPHPNEQVGGAVAVLDAGAVNDAADQQTAGVSEDMALPTLHLLAGVEAPHAALSVVLTDWLSTMPALGLASRPSASRTAKSRRWLTVRQVPSSRQAQKERCTVERGGNSRGSSRYGQPARSL